MADIFNYKGKILSNPRIIEKRLYNKIQLNSSTYWFFDIYIYYKENIS
jgi:hypothetical protein